MSIKKMNNINLILSSGADVGLIAKVIFSLNMVTTNTVKVEKIDDKEEYLNIKVTITQVKINKSDSWIDNAVIIPR